MSELRELIDLAAGAVERIVAAELHTPKPAVAPQPKPKRRGRRQRAAVPDDNLGYATLSVEEWRVVCGPLIGCQPLAIQARQAIVGQVQGQTGSVRVWMSLDGWSALVAELLKQGRALLLARSIVVQLSRSVKQ